MLNFTCVIADVIKTTISDGVCAILDYWGYLFVCTDLHHQPISFPTISGIFGRTAMNFAVIPYWLM